MEELYNSRGRQYGVGTARLQPGAARSRMDANMARDHGAGAPAQLGGSSQGSGSQTKPAAATASSQNGASKSSWSKDYRGTTYAPSFEDDDDLDIVPSVPSSSKPSAAKTKSSASNAAQSAASKASQGSAPVAKAPFYEKEKVRQQFKPPGPSKKLPSFIKTLSSKNDNEPSDPSNSAAATRSEGPSIKRSLSTELDPDLAKAAGLDVLQGGGAEELGDVADGGKERKKLKKWSSTLDDAEGKDSDEAENEPTEQEPEGSIQTARLKNAKGKAGLKVFKPSVQKANANANANGNGNANATKNLILQAADANFIDRNELAQGGGTDGVPKLVKELKQCPFCMKDMPAFITTDLRKIMQTLLDRYHRLGPLGVSGSDTVGACIRHEDERTYVLEGIKARYPRTHDWDELEKRALQKRHWDTMKQRIKDPMSSAWYKELKDKIAQHGRKAMSVETQMSNMEEQRAGYYGEKGWERLLRLLGVRFTGSSNKTEAGYSLSDPENVERIAPVPATTFLHSVLMPELICSLLSEDLEKLNRPQSLAAAKKLRKDSYRYGLALFPAEGDGVDATELQQARKKYHEENPSSSSSVEKTQKPGSQKATTMKAPSASARPVGRERPLSSSSSSTSSSQSYIEFLGTHIN